MEGTGPVKAALGREAPGVGAAGEAGALKKGLRLEEAKGAEDGQAGSGFLTPHPVVQMELPYLGPQPCVASERVFPGLPQVLWPRGQENQGLEIPVSTKEVTL